MLADELEAIARTWRGCALCALADARTQVVFGRPYGELRTGSVLCVGEGPGEAEDAAGIPFCGPSGKFLMDEMFGPAGLTDCFIANTVCCRPPANRDPRPEETEACKGHLEDIIRVLRPKAILAVGRIARERIEDLAKEHEIPVTAVVHPSWFLRQGGKKPLLEVAKIQRMLSEMQQKPVDLPSGEEDVLFGDDSPVPSCQHDFVGVGRIKGREDERPLMVCSRCGMAE